MTSWRVDLLAWAPGVPAPWGPEPEQPGSGLGKPGAPPERVGKLAPVPRGRALLLILLLICWPHRLGAAEPRYPDLRALPPSELLPTVVPIDGAEHHVLRFTASIINAGPGPLEIRGDSDSASGRTLVYQRVYDEPGGVAEYPVGTFVFHPAHNHWHFEHFAAYELWTRDAYEAWLASGRQQGLPSWQGSKTTGQQLEGESFCLRDSQPLPQVAAGPATRRYSDCAAAEQGLSVGWADVYPYFLPEQWIDLGLAPLPDGEYVLRVVADPLNLLLESPEKADPDRESPAANEGITTFSVQQGCLDAAVLALPQWLVCRDPSQPLDEDDLDNDNEAGPPD